MAAAEQSRVRSLALIAALPEWPNWLTRIQGARHVAYARIGDQLFRGDSLDGADYARFDLAGRINDWIEAQAKAR